MEAMPHAAGRLRSAHPAGLRKRFAASSIDAGLFVGIAMVQNVLTDLWVWNQPEPTIADKLGRVLTVAAPLAVFGLTQLALIARRGQSLGKLLMGIRVADQDTGLPTVAARNLTHEFIKLGSLPVLAWLLHNPNATGKDTGVWNQCYLMAENYYLRLP
jgi:uncharacterized RDD family membrane protein YckC